jgi:hypothetical protein
MATPESEADAGLADRDPRVTLAEQFDDLADLQNLVAGRRNHRYRHSLMVVI